MEKENITIKLNTLYSSTEHTHKYGVRSTYTILRKKQYRILVGSQHPVVLVYSIFYNK